MSIGETWEAQHMPDGNVNIESVTSIPKTRPPASPASIHRIAERANLIAFLALMVSAGSMAVTVLTILQR